MFVLIDSELSNKISYGTRKRFERSDLLFIAEGASFVVFVKNCDFYDRKIL